MSAINGMYGLLESDGSISVWSASTSKPVTFMPADVKPIGSNLTARKNHPNGIRLTKADAKAIGLEIRGQAAGVAYVEALPPKAISMPMSWQEIPVKPLPKIRQTKPRKSKR
jgi:hypothetical protein